MKKLWILMGAVSVLIAGSGLFVAHRYALAVNAASTIAVKPFVYETAQISYVQNPAGIVMEHRTVARRQDSSRAMIGSFPADTKMGIVRRVDWADGRSSMLSDAVRGRMTGFMPDLAVARRKRQLQNPPRGCMYPGEITVAEEQIAGQRSYRIERMYGTTQRVTEWRLPDYECESVQMVREDFHDGVWKPALEARLVAFLATVPDPKIFDDWASYEELPPSQLRDRLYRSSGVTPERCRSCFKDLAELDARYQQAQVRQR